MRFHPICLLFPRMTDEELQELADDIRQNGLQNAIVLHEGKILDGRNRYLACPMAGIKPRFVQWDGDGSPLQWVVCENMVRRHLTSSQRAVIALELLPMLEKEAHERKRSGKTIRKNLRKVAENGEAQTDRRPSRPHEFRLRPNPQNHPERSTRAARHGSLRNAEGPRRCQTCPAQQGGAERRAAAL